MLEIPPIYLGYPGTVHRYLGLVLIGSSCTSTNDWRW